MSEPRRVRMSDIAAAAGVHISTVSLALRNSPRLPLETRERIQEIARKLGYQEDPHMRALVSYRERARRQQSPTPLAFVTHWSAPIATVPHHRHFYRGAKRRATELGFRLDHFPLSSEGVRSSLGRILAARGIEGVILSSFYKGARRLELPWDEFSVVRIEMQPRWPPVPTVAVNHIQVIREAVRKVIELGYRRPALMIGDDWSPLVDDRWELGFAWEQQRLPPADRLPVFYFVKTTEGSLRRYRFKDWYYQHRPDVLLAPSAVALERLHELGLRAPQDVALVDPFQEAPNPQIAGVVHRLEDVGAVAVDTLAHMLFQHTRGVPAGGIETYVDGYWSDGPTCPARVSVPAAASLISP